MENNFEEVQLNMSEFSGCSLMAKDIRKALAPLHRGWFEQFTQGRLIANFKCIQIEDTQNKKGSRSILLNANTDMLKNFNFIEHLGFLRVADVNYQFSASSKDYKVELCIWKFDATKAILAPAGATHFRFIFAPLYVANYIKRTDAYEPANKETNCKTDIVFSDYLNLNDKIPSIKIVSDIGLKDYKTKAFDTSLLYCVGIGFYQEVGGKYYEFATGNALTIMQVTSNL